MTPSPAPPAVKADNKKRAMIYLGIDPGKSGGIAIIDGSDVYTLKLADATPRDTFRWLMETVPYGVTSRSLIGFAVIEKVGATPQMGVTSAFTFGRSYGFIEGLLAAAGCPYVFVTPQKWQKALGCLSGGDKNVTKAKAQQLYPNEKITHATADALLLATYCRQNHSQLF